MKHRLHRLLQDNVGRRGLRRNAVLSLAQAVVGVLALFITYRFLLAQAGAAALGLWSLTVGTLSFVRLADISGGQALTRLVAVAEANPTGAKAAAFIDTVVLFSLLLYGVLSLVAWLPFGWILSIMVEEGRRAEALRLLPWAFASLITMVLAATQTSALDGLQRADLRSLVMMAGYVVFTLLALLLIPTHGVRGLALAQVAQQILVLVGARMISVRLVQGLSLVPVQWSLPALRQSVGYGLRLQANTLAGMVYDPLSRLLINHFDGLAVLGVYEVASRVVVQVRSLLIAAATPLVPAFASAHDKDEKRATDLLHRSIWMTTMIGGAFAIGLILLAPIVSLLFFAQVKPLFVILVIALASAYFINTSVVPLYLYAQGAGLLRWNIAGQVVIAVTTLAATPVFAMLGNGSYSGLGVAVGIASGSLVSYFGNAHMISSAERALPVRMFLALAVITAIVAGLVIYLFGMGG